MVIGNDGADKVVVTMTDEAGKTVDSKNYAMEGENGKVTFTPSKSGKYTFAVNAVRDGEEDKACAESRIHILSTIISNFRLTFRMYFS